MSDWIAEVIGQTGYFGVALLAFLENIFPPIPSELIMPLAGFQAAQGNLSVVGVILAGTLGSVAGAAVWYALGARLGMARIERLAKQHGRWLTMHPSEVRRAGYWFRRHGAATVLVGRLIPGIRSLVSLPAGIHRMQLSRFAIFTALGTGLWTSLLVLAGYFLQSRYAEVADYLNPASNVFCSGLAIWYVWRVFSFRK